MISDVADTEAEATVPMRVVDARALIGWMRPKEAALAQASQNQANADRPEYEERAAQARAAVLERPLGLDQSSLIDEVPASLSDHIDRLREDAFGSSYFAEGAVVRMADLSRVRAVQPVVKVPQIPNTYDAADLLGLAQRTLPVGVSHTIPAQFDSSRNAWLFSSPDPNLRIVGNFSGAVQEGVNGFGFAVRIQPSFVQIAEFRGMYILRDGYHRALEFLMQGITRVPVFVRSYEGIDELGLPVGMLPLDAYIGDSPPTIADYLDDTVSAAVKAPELIKIVVIQGLEVTMLS